MSHRAPIILAAFLAAAGPVLGETAVRIVGNQSLSEQEILTNLGGRLDHITLREATRPRAADAAFLVEQAYQLAGFNDVTVYWKVVDKNTIRLRIDEGKRDVIGEVTINNVPNPKLNETLVELFQLNPKKRATGLNEFPIRDEDVPAGIQLMEAQMQSIGFYDAEVILASRQPNPETGKIDFTFDVKAGRISKIAPPVFRGETTPGLAEAVSQYVGEPATTPNLNSVRARVSEQYQAAGFLRAKIRMGIEREGLQLTPVFDVTRGQRFKLRNIELAGLGKTDPDRVLTRLDDLQGEYLDGNVAEKRIRQLIATGAFSNVRTEIEPVAGETVDVTLRLTEAEARGISGTAGFDSFEGFLLGAAYYDRNFLGKVRNFSAGFEITQRSLLGEISLADPWLAGSDVAGKARLYALSKDYEGYNALRSGIEASAIWPVTEHYTVDASLGWAIVSTDADGLPIAQLGEQDYQNPYLRITQTLDYRDNPVLPKEGWHLELPVELGAAIGDNSSAYFKAGIEGSYYRPIGESGQLAVGARAGFLIPSGGSGRLPIDLRYFNGGARSVRSFPDRELGPWSTTGYPVGGQSYWVTNIEYIHTIAGPLKAAAFFDAGGLSPDWEDFGTGDPEMAVGLGLRLDLPIGPVRLEYGHNLTQDGRDPSGSWHFAIGTAF
ncbi:outermembrane surface antigen protein [Haloferula helveola]|uniref:Outermembrane surface antigen protein n=1 Tax=Haloferula helveola TaxID=490095 RepID=A0ABM7RRN1_9BACT|nr:outermembrane surface antigen protein [Haloferula helveola]